MTAEDVAAQLARERALKSREEESIGRLTGAIAQQFQRASSPRSWPAPPALAQSLPPTATSTS